jgi:hypothetical protein
VTSGDDSARHSAGNDSEAAAEHKACQSFPFAFVTAGAATLDRRAEVGANDAACGRAEEGSDDDACGRAVDTALDVDATQRRIRHVSRLRQAGEAKGVTETRVEDSGLTVEPWRGGPDANGVAWLESGQRRGLRDGGPRSGKHHDDREQELTHICQVSQSLDENTSATKVNGVPSGGAVTRREHAAGQSTGDDPSGAAQDQSPEPREIVVVAVAAVELPPDEGADESTYARTDQCRSEHPSRRPTDSAPNIDASKGGVGDINRKRLAREAQRVAQASIKQSGLAVETGRDRPNTDCVAGLKAGERHELRSRSTTGGKENEDGEEFLLHGGVRHSSHA